MVLGPVGAKALITTQERYPELKGMLPRVTLGWLKNVSAHSPTIAIPGTKATLTLKKNEDDTFAGALKCEELHYTFESADLYHLSAITSKVFDFTDSFDIQSDLYHKLSKSLDQLVKEAPSGNAGFIEPTQVLPPQAPMKSNKKPKLPRKSTLSLPAVKIEKSEFSALCPVCKSTSFNNSKFTGCKCIKNLSKSVKIEEGLHGSVVIVPGNDWNMDDVEKLILSVKKV